MKRGSESSLVRALGGARFVVASVVIHAFCFVLLVLARPHADSRRRQAIRVDILHPPPPVAAPAPDPVAAAERTEPAPVRRSSHPVLPPVEKQPRDRRRPDETEPEVAPALPEKQPETEERERETSPAPRAPINLFSSTAITAAVPSLNAPVVRDPGGTTRRVGDGHGVPGGRDAVADREEAAGRIRQFFDSDAGEQRVKAGQVAPRWRDAEREIVAQFHPPAAAVSDENVVTNFFKQWLATRPQGGTTPRGVDPSTEGGFLGMGPGVASLSDPSSEFRVRTEVEVIVGADGKVQSQRVISSSGRRKFDQAALRAVREAVEDRGELDEKGAVVTRWLIESWLQVAPPTSLGFTFDESSGRLGANYPLKKSVRTKVALLSVTPRTP